MALRGREICNRYKLWGVLPATRTIRPATPMVPGVSMVDTGAEWSFQQAPGVKYGAKLYLQGQNDPLRDKQLPGNLRCSGD